MKKVVILLLSLVLGVGLVACGQTGGSSAVNSEYKQIIASAAKKLNDTYTNYIISTTVEHSALSQEYIECVKGDDIYTEYSVDEDGNIGTISYGSAANVSYTLMDWTHDGQFYTFGYDESVGEVYYKFPENYGTKYAYDREMLFVNRLLAGATKIEAVDDLQLGISGVVESYKAYRLTVNSDTIASILGSDYYGVYQSIKDGEKSGSNMSKLCDFYLEDFELQYTYSIGKVIVAIDQNDMLKFVQIEVGGLGTTMYVTKSVVDISNQNLRDTPNFDGAITIVSTMQDLADFVAQYPDHDSAVAAVRELYNHDYTQDDISNDEFTGLIDTDDQNDISDNEQTTEYDDVADPVSTDAA